MNVETVESFFTSGGALPLSAPSYVERAADSQLFERLLQGEFCYILTSRQVGKSSLMIRTALRLQAQGVQSVILDLNAVGISSQRESWYYTLLIKVGQAVSLRAEMRACWQSEPELDCVHRWIEGLRTILRQRKDLRLVIFVDEVDSVLSLPFAKDEFFAAIRACYNRRAQEPEFERLTFCLLGVASPTDLIDDPRLTPFNIGTRIELKDFTPAEAAPLAAGLRPGSAETQRQDGKDEGANVAGNGSKIRRMGLKPHSGPQNPRKRVREIRLGGFGNPERGFIPVRSEFSDTLLERILYWTGGHPYLTQRLCRAFVEAGGTTIEDVDTVCATAFLSAQGQASENHFDFVRDRMLRSEADVAGLLTLYRRIAEGRRVPDEKTAPFVTTLKLCGIVRSENGFLRVRNRIYARVFDRKWIHEHMPDAEKRRQRTAFRRGLALASLLGGLVLLTVGGLASIAVNAARREKAAKEQAEHILYIADMGLAHHAWENGSVRRTVELLEAHRPRPGQTDRRDFAWHYLNGLSHSNLHTFTGHQRMVFTAAFSPDGRLIASGSGDKTIKLWDAASRKEIGTLTGHTAVVLKIAFSPDGTLLASGSEDGTARLWDVRTRQQTGILPQVGSVHSLAFSPDGKQIATASRNDEGKGLVTLWDAASGEPLRQLWNQTEFHSVAFSPNNRYLAIGDADCRIRLWDRKAQRLTRWMEGHTGSVRSVRFSPDSRLLASGGADGMARLWDVSAARPIGAPLRCQGHVASVSFSRDGTMLLTGSWDEKIRLWDVRTGRPKAVIKGSTERVNEVCFSPDGRQLLSTNGSEMKLWDVARSLEQPLRTASLNYYSLALSPDSAMMAAAGNNGRVALWNLSTGKFLYDVPVASKGTAGCIAFSPDGRWLAYGSYFDGRIRIWDVNFKRWSHSWQESRNAVTILTFTPDSTMLAVSGAGTYNISLWDIATARLVKTVPIAQSNLALAFSREGRFALQGHLRDEISLWEGAFARKLGNLIGHSNAIHDGAFSPDGHLVATAGWDRTVILWETRTLQPVATLHGHLDSVACLAFSPDGKTLATGSVDKTVRLWDIASHREILTLAGHPARITDLAFSSDGRTLVSGSSDGTIRFWRANR